MQTIETKQLKQKATFVYSQSSAKNEGAPSIAPGLQKSITP